MSLLWRVLNLTLWVLQGLTALVFLYFGAVKVSYFTGCLEVVCAILLVIPKTSAIAALLLACTMVGAILTHLFVLREPPIVNVVPVSLLLILTLVAWKRRGFPPPSR